jgi:hypothetical protein
VNPLEPRSREQKWATRGLMLAASRAQDAPRGSAEQRDARTSANDWRAALSIALGAPLHLIDPTFGTSSTRLWRSL